MKLEYKTKDGKEFHDHYFDSDDIIRICNLK